MSRQTEAIAEQLAENLRDDYASALVRYGDERKAAAAAYCTDAEMRAALAYGDQWMMHLPEIAARAVRRVSPMRMSTAGGR
jgi:hypothetical protein